MDPIPAETQPEEETKPAETKPSQGGSNGPQTGDAGMGLWITLMVMSLAAVTVLLVGKKRLAK